MPFPTPGLVRFGRTIEGWLEILVLVLVLVHFGTTKRQFFLLGLMSKSITGAVLATGYLF